MIADRGSQIADRKQSQLIADEIEHMIVCDHDDRRPYDAIADLIAICDPRSYGNQPLDRTWFYLLRSSAITIADLIAIRDHMETSL